MMRKKMQNRVLAILLSAVMAFVPAGYAMAAETAPAETVSVAETSETDTLESQEEVTETEQEKQTDATEEISEEMSEQTTEAVESGGEQTETESEAATETESMSETESASESEQESEDISMTETEDLSETETLTETETETITETETVTETVTEEETSLFPGLGEGETLSAAAMKEKRILAGYADEADEMDEGEDYVSGEIIVAVGSREEAEEYASAFRGTLKDYMDGAALIMLPENRSVMQAVAASADAKILLPAAWPNYYRYADTEMYYEGETEADNDRDTEDFGAIADAFNDTYLNPGSSGYQYYHSIISSTAAWREGYRGGGVTVAVLDTGIKIGHEDVSAQALDNGATGSDNYGSEDGHGHGTHVAGIIGAKLNNGKGGSGVAPEASLVSVKVLSDDDGSGSSWAIMEGVKKAVSNGADIINMSLGGPGYSDVEEELYQKVYEDGVAVFAAAGNESSNSAHYPAAYGGTISVAALDKNCAKAYFSNYGSKVDYCAPGVKIYSTYYLDTDAYEVMSGTSQATPVMAGTAAVLMASSGMDRGLSGKNKVDALRGLLDKGVVKASGSGIGKGYVNLAKALGISTVLTAPKAPTFSAKNGSTFSAPSVSIELTAEKEMQIWYSLNGKAVTYKNGVVSDGAVLYQGPITLTGASKVKVSALAVNPNSGLVSKTVSAAYNLKPLISKIALQSPSGLYTIARGKSLQLKAVITPEYAANKAITWTVSPAKQGVTVSSSGKVTVSAKALTGNYLITATARDAGKVSSTPYHVIVEESAALISSIAAKPKSLTLYAGREATAAIAVKRGKDEAEVSDLNWVTSDSRVAAVTVDEANGGIRITGVGAGTASITGTAKDGGGKAVTVKVTVKQYAEAVSITGDAKVAAGKSITLKAAVAPTNAANKKVIWSVVQAGNGGVTVSSAGKVTVKAGAEAGSYVIRATAADGSGVYADKYVTVYKGTISKILLGTKSAPVKTASVFRVTNRYGAATSVTVPVTLEGIGGDSSVWTVASSNKGIATAVKSGNTIIVKATGRAVGKVTVTVATTDGSNKKASCTVTVKNPPTKLMLAPEAGRINYLAAGKTLKLSAVLESESGKLDAGSKKLKWTSSRPYVVSVDQNGKLTGKSDSGTPVTITASATDGSGLTATYQVYGMSKIFGISVGNSSKYKGYVGQAAAVPIYVDTIGYFCQAFVTESSSDAVTTEIKYDDYKNPYLYIVCNKRGSATIKVKCMDGNSTSCTIKVQVYE